MPSAYVNGKLLDELDASISVFDHGLIVGDGVFETILLHRGAPFALRRHLQRLERSARGLGIEPPSSTTVADAVHQVVAASGWQSGRIRVTATAGISQLGSGREHHKSTLVVAVGELGAHAAEGIVATVPFTRNEHGALVGLKTTSYAENALALSLAEARGADEAIFPNTAGLLCEGTGSNVFVVIDGKLSTPTLSSGCLAGITRELVLEMGFGEELDVEMTAFQGDRLAEAFLTSTLRGVQPIAAIDGIALASSPGPVTAAAMAAYEALLDGDAEPTPGIVTGA